MGFGSHGANEQMHVCFKNAAQRTGSELKVGFLLDCDDDAWFKPEAWDRIFTEIHEHSWDIVLLSPPCKTFSRAREHRRTERHGPGPSRSHTYPFGFPWLAERSRAAVDRENFYLRQSFNVIKAAIKSGMGWLLVHPEDLGALHSGQRPASIWQLDELRAFVEGDEHAATWAVHMCTFGGDLPHPTRLATNLAGPEAQLRWPQFDATGSYVGPIGRCEHLHHGGAGIAHDGSWKTDTPLPLAFCEHVVQMACDWQLSGRATDDVGHPAEQFATCLLEQSDSRKLGKHDGEALARLLEYEAPHPAAVADAAPEQSGGKAFFGGAYTKGGVTGLRRSCRLFPQSLKCLTLLLRDAFPNKPFSSLVVFNNVKSTMHKDVHNAPYPNLLLALTTFQGGQVWMESSHGHVVRMVRGIPRKGVLLPVAQAPQELQAHNCFHQTEAWTGDRVLLVGFTVTRLHSLSPPMRDNLLSLGFVLPPSAHLPQQGGEGLADREAEAVPAMALKQHELHATNTPPGGTILEAPGPGSSTPSGGTILEAPGPVLGTPSGGTILEAPGLGTLRFAPLQEEPFWRPRIAPQQEGPSCWHLRLPFPTNPMARTLVTPKSLTHAHPVAVGRPCVVGTHRSGVNL